MVEKTFKYQLPNIAYDLARDFFVCSIRSAAYCAPCVLTKLSCTYVAPISIQTDGKGPVLLVTSIIQASAEVVGLNLEV